MCVVVARRVTAVRLARFTLVRGKQRRVVMYTRGGTSDRAERRRATQARVTWPGLRSRLVYTRVRCGSGS